MSATLDKVKPCGFTTLLGYVILCWITEYAVSPAISLDAQTSLQACAPPVLCSMATPFVPLAWPHHFVQDGRTPLYAAALGNHLEVVQQLVDKGALLDIPNNVRFFSFRFGSLQISCTGFFLRVGMDLGLGGRSSWKG